VRGVTVGSSHDALANAGTLIEIERTLGLFHEAQVQAVLRGLHAPFSVYYMLGFAPLIVGLLFWLALRQPDRYRELRTLLLLSVGTALVIHAAYPVAPPRLMPELGITDTVGLSAREASFAGVRFNPYAAMPSMHVGWSLLVAVAGFRAARLLVVRVLFAGQPALMTIAVTATGNHFFLDSVAGAGVALGAIALDALARSARRTQANLPRPERPARPDAHGHRRGARVGASRQPHLRTLALPADQVSRWPAGARPALTARVPRGRPFHRTEESST
jgi:hypothetical protein